LFFVVDCSWKYPIITISFCSFLCDFFLSTEVLFNYIIYSRVFRIKHVYICSTRLLLYRHIIKLNQCCIVLIHD
jgi:hypothetical protein